MNFVEIQGVSGARYRYKLVETGDPNTPAGGNYLYLKGEEVLFVGQTTNLATGARDRWREAFERFGADRLYIRLNVNGAIREQEQRDVAAAIAPPMNGVLD